MKLLARTRIKRVVDKWGRPKYVCQRKFKWDLLGLSWANLDWNEQYCTFSTLEEAKKYTIERMACEPIDVSYFEIK